MPTYSDLVLAFGRIIATKVVGDAKAVLANLRLFENADDDEEAEESGEEIIYGQLGVYARPDPAVKAASATGLNPEGYAETVVIRGGDSNSVIAAKDMRLSTRVNPAEGEVGLVQYGGGFVSLKWNAEHKGTNVTIMAPVLTTGGAVSSSHALSLDTSTAVDAVLLAHRLGMAIIMTKDGELVLRSDTGAARIIMKGDQITLQGGKIICNGNVVVGANPVGAVPFAGGPSMVPCPSLFLSLT